MIDLLKPLAIKWPALAGLGCLLAYLPWAVRTYWTPTRIPRDDTWLMTGIWPGLALLAVVWLRPRIRKGVVEIWRSCSTWSTSARQRSVVALLVLGLGCTGSLFVTSGRLHTIALAGSNALLLLCFVLAPLAPPLISWRRRPAWSAPPQETARSIADVVLVAPACVLFVVAYWLVWHVPLDAGGIAPRCERLVLDTANLSAPTSALLLGTPTVATIHEPVALSLPLRVFHKDQSEYSVWIAAAQMNSTVPARAVRSVQDCEP